MFMGASPFVSTSVDSGICMEDQGGGLSDHWLVLVVLAGVFPNSKKGRKLENSRILRRSGGSYDHPRPNLRNARGRTLHSCAFCPRFNQLPLRSEKISSSKLGQGGRSQPTHKDLGGKLSWYGHLRDFCRWNLSKKKGVWPVGRCFSCWCSNPQLSSGKKNQFGEGVLLPNVAGWSWSMNCESISQQWPKIFSTIFQQLVHTAQLATHGNPPK